MCRVGHTTANPTSKVAVKSLMRNHPRFNLAAIKNEINTMLGINHPRCIGLIEAHICLSVHTVYA